MLEKLLELISAGSNLSLGELAHRLGVTQDLVEQMLADLVRAGYLRQVEDSSQEGCVGCSLSEACRPPVPKMWVRSQKGRA